MRSLPATWARLVALVLILAGAERASAQSFGFMSMPSSFAQYLGYGYGPGRHAPLVVVPGQHPTRTPRKAYMPGYAEPAPYEAIGCGGWGASCGCGQNTIAAPTPVVENSGAQVIQPQMAPPQMVGPQLGSPQLGLPMISATPNSVPAPTPTGGPMILRSPPQPTLPSTIFPAPMPSPQARPMITPVPSPMAPPTMRRSNVLPPEKMPAPDDRQAWQFMSRR